jgi:L-histidine N-alpha-methyltransferase
MPGALATYLPPSAYAEALRGDALAGLTSAPKSLPPKYFYDQRGSELFDEITRLPEYYPTRTERGLLAAHAAEIAAVTRGQTLVELGSGSSEKTRLLLDAMGDSGTLRRFVPFDVDGAVLRRVRVALAAEYPGLEVRPVVGDFERHLGLLPHDGRRLVGFLGSTIGNFEPAARARFLAGIRAALEPGDSLLLGTDLVKDAGRLVAAYDDRAGVTAEFNRNVLAVLNRELGADFDLTAFEHVALWDAERAWIEMRLRSVTSQRVRVPALDLVVPFAAGEEMRTEISAKFRVAGVEAELAAAGLRMVRWWTDPAGDFGLSLSVPA